MDETLFPFNFGGKAPARRANSRSHPAPPRSPSAAPAPRIARACAPRASFPARLGSRALELLFQLGSGLAHSATARSRLRSGRTKLAAARRAICAFERQDHLVGTVTGPLPVGPTKDRAYQS